jgi:hypothetical protein
LSWPKSPTSLVLVGWPSSILTPDYLKDGEYHELTSMTLMAKYRITMVLCHLFDYDNIDRHIPTLAIGATKIGGWG